MTTPVSAASPTQPVVHNQEPSTTCSVVQWLGKIVYRMTVGSNCQAVAPMVVDKQGEGEWVVVSKTCKFKKNIKL